MTVSVVREVFPQLVHPEHAVLSNLAQLHLACFLPREMHPEMFRRGHWWIAYSLGTPIAFGGMLPSTRWSDTVYLCRSGVLEGFRGQGLQKRLITARLAKAQKLGMRWVITDTRRNPASANSLISCGFRMYQPAAPWGLRDACYWKKELK